MMSKQRVFFVLLMVLFCSLEVVAKAATEPMIAEDADLALAVGDTLRIEVDRYERYSGDFKISELGTIDHPLLGRVKVANMTLQHAREIILDRFNLYLKRPEVSVNLTESTESPVLVESPKQVYLFGEIERPGTYPIGDGMTLLQLIAQSGGPILHQRRDSLGNVRSSGANIKDISIFRTDGDTLRVDLEHIQDTGDQSQNVILQPGDTVFVPTGVRGNFSILGLVRRPGAYPFPAEGNLNLMEALVQAGGFAKNGSLQNIRIVRTSHGDPQTFLINLWDTLKEGRLEMIPEIQIGDVIYVTHTPFYHWERFVSSIRGAAVASESVRIISDFDQRTGQNIGTD